MSCRASPSHARRHHRPPHHRLQDGRCADSASCCRGGLTCAAFALPRLSTTVACSSPRRQNALDSLGDARRICGGDRSMSSHVNCGRNSFCDKATTGAPGGENGRKSKLPPSMLLYGAAIHWLSSNRRTGSPATASLQSTHEQIAVDNGELNSSSSTRAAAAASATASEFSSSKQQQQARQAASPAGTDTTLLASSSSSSSHFLGVNGSENKKKRSEELEQETSISLSSDDTLGVTTGKTKTPNGGHCHTPESRGKISAANKGKTPWNKGGNHSEETRRKIAEGAREAARRRKVAMATAMVRKNVQHWCS